MLQCMGFLQFRMFPSTFVILYPNVAEEEEKEEETLGGSEDLDEFPVHCIRTRKLSNLM